MFRSQSIQLIAIFSACLWLILFLLPFDAAANMQKISAGVTLANSILTPLTVIVAFLAYITHSGKRADDLFNQSAIQLGNRVPELFPRERANSCHAPSLIESVQPQIEGIINGGHASLEDLTKKLGDVFRTAKDHNQKGVPTPEYFARQNWFAALTTLRAKANPELIPLFDQQFGSISDEVRKLMLLQALYDGDRTGIQFLADTNMIQGALPGEGDQLIELIRQRYTSNH